MKLKTILRIGAMSAMCTLGTMGMVSGLSAQDVIINTGVPAGSPQQGVDVPSRMTPSQSQQLLTPAATPTAPGATGSAEASGTRNPYQGILDRRRSGQGEGEDGTAFRDPFRTEQISGFGYGGRDRSFIVNAEDIYRGVIPGVQDSLPHISRYQRNAATGAQNALTWVGFQPFDDFTRVFVQVGRTPQYSVHESPDGLTITVHLRQTRISLRNFARSVDARFFGRSVDSIRAHRVDNGVDIVIQLGRNASYTITSSGTRGEYLFIDFADTN